MTDLLYYVEMGIIFITSIEFVAYNFTYKYYICCIYCHCQKIFNNNENILCSYLLHHLALMLIENTNYFYLLLVSLYIVTTIFVQNSKLYCTLINIVFILIEELYFQHRIIIANLIYGMYFLVFYEKNFKTASYT